MQLQRIWDAPPFAVDYAEGDGDLVIAFASVGADPARPPAPEFVATATGRGIGSVRPALLVSDASRSWANGPGFAPALLGALAHVQPRAKIATIGLSMGAFSALVAARIIPVDVVLAFGPQWFAGGGPGDDRWANWRAGLPPLHWPHAPLPERAQAYVFHGMDDDLPQALPFPPTPGTDHILFPGLGHSGLVPHLKARGTLAGLTAAALQGDRRRVLRIAASAGGKLRHRLI